MAPYAHHPNLRRREAIIPAEIMALAAGARLGPYEVIAPLGAGGMGEVYRARDTRLDRVVAINAGEAETFRAVLRGAQEPQSGPKES
jgi:serine/threonine protein kinase